MKVSLIVAVYKDIEALDLIVKALKIQTYKNFEFIIAEDNNSQEMKDYISSIKDIEVKHTSQEDDGIRKMRSLNNAIIKSSGDYLIFIDGDCIPYSTFVEAHVKLAEDGYIISGRRCNLGPKYTQKIRLKNITSYELEKSFLWRFPLIAKDAIEKHTEAGFYFSPEGFIYNNFLKNSDRSTSLLGCNYSCFKKDMLAINGYDEGYGQSAVGDDTDLQWRFKALGLKVKSAKNIANIFHLYHEREFRKEIPWEMELQKMKKNRSDNVFVCKKGLNTHDDFVK